MPLMNGNSDRLRADETAPTDKVLAPKKTRPLGLGVLLSSRPHGTSPPDEYLTEDFGSGGESQRYSPANLAPVNLQTLNLPHILTYCLSSDLSTLLYCSPNVERILGCPPHQIQTQGGILLRHVHQDDRFRVLNAIEHVFENGESTTITYRWLGDAESPTAKSRVLLNHCTAVPSDLGKIIVGIIVPLDESLLAELPPTLQREATRLERVSEQHANHPRQLTKSKRNMLPSTRSDLLLKSALPLASQLDDHIRLTVHLAHQDGPLPKNVSASTFLTLRKIFWSLKEPALKSDSLHISFHSANRDALKFSAVFEKEKKAPAGQTNLQAELLALSQKLELEEPNLQITVHEEMHQEQAVQRVDISLFQSRT